MVSDLPVSKAPATGAGRALDPFPIVLGHARSGTTMLRAMLDSHPELAVPPESYFVVSMLSGPAADTFDFDTFATTLEDDKYFKDWQLPREKFAFLRDDRRVADTADAVAGLYYAYAQQHGKARYADKTPSHLQAVDVLAARFPNARFLHLVRDGRDVAASVVTMHFGASQFAEAARGWRQRVMQAHEAGLRLGPQRYQEIHYEDLVADPERVLREICRFFEIEFSPAMLDYHERAEQLLGGLRHTQHIQGIRKPPTAGVRNWRLDLTPHQIAVFDEVAGAALVALGYERSGLRRSQRARAEAWTTEVRITLRRVRRVYAARLVRKLRSYYRRARL